MFSHRIRYFNELTPNAVGTAASAPSGMISPVGYHGMTTSAASRHPNGAVGALTTDPLITPNGVVGASASLPVVFPAGALFGGAGNTTAQASGTYTIGAADKRHLNMTAVFTANVTIQLPTGATILRGDVFRIEVANTDVSFEATVVASDASNAGGHTDGYNIITRGFIEVRALQDNPSTGTHWAVQDVYEYRKSTLTFNFSGGDTIAPTSVMKLVRRNLHVSATFAGGATGTPAANSAQMASSTNLPDRFRPITSSVQVLTRSRDGGTESNTPGFMTISAAGAVTVTKDLVGTASFGAGSANTGFSSGVTLSWLRLAN